MLTVCSMICSYQDSPFVIPSPEERVEGTGNSSCERAEDLWNYFGHSFSVENVGMHPADVQDNVEHAQQ